MQERQHIVWVAIRADLITEIDEIEELRGFSTNQAVERLLESGLAFQALQKITISLSSNGIWEKDGE